ncbi:hypothetical protein C2845_PM12G12240 [Panicum miliaceum]|uniref:Secreted protein n=1 Tax=Panicum miliaceum TaxID=4540 RepID=A0A3L6QFB0_PANMI|nr:hypothetical protein C2845_PM12G12240 [Panicum miliaceum]
MKLYSFHLLCMQLAVVLLLQDVEQRGAEAALVLQHGGHVHDGCTVAAPPTRLTHACWTGRSSDRSTPMRRTGAWRVATIVRLTAAALRPTIRTSSFSSSPPEAGHAAGFPAPPRRGMLGLVLQLLHAAAQHGRPAPRPRPEQQGVPAPRHRPPPPRILDGLRRRRRPI